MKQEKIDKGVIISVFILILMFIAVILAIIDGNKMEEYCLSNGWEGATQNINTICNVCYNHDGRTPDGLYKYKYSGCID